MELRNLGKSGLRVSLVGLGCNNFGGRMDLESSKAVIHKALDAGITLFDTADAYGNRGGSETAMGQILGDRRKDIVLATKFGMAMDDGEKKGASRRYIMTAVEASLKRLKTDWIDLYQVHRHDPLTPIEETLRALDDLVRYGKVRYVGCSNFTAAQMIEAQWAARHSDLNAFVSCQDEYSLLKRDLDGERLGVMERYGLGLLPFFPLASGLLTGKHKRGAAAAGTRLASRAFAAFMNDANFDIVEKLEAFVKARGRTHAGAGFLLARRAADGRQHHRGRDQAGADRGERQGDGLGADAGGHGGDRQDHRRGEFSPYSSLPDLAVERIRPAAAQRDREQDQAPEQRILVAACGPAEALRHVDERHHQQMDRGGGGEEAREQAERDAEAADGFEEHDDIGERQRRLDAALCEASRGEGGDARLPFRDAVRQQHQPRGEAHDHP